MSDTATQQPSGSEQNQPRAKRRRWPRVLFMLFVLLLIAVWFAPAIVAKTPLLNRLARGATADINGSLDIGDASLGWLSNIELRDITLTDPQGRVLARVAKVTTSRTLVSLIRDQSDIGEIVIDHPVIDIVCEKNTTNLEGVIQKFLAESGAAPGPTRTPISLRITDGTLTVRDTETSRFTEFHDLQASVTIPASRPEPMSVKVTANAPERIEADLSIGETGRVRFAAGNFAVETLTPLLRRIEPGLSIAGALTADFTATWGKDAASVDGLIGLKNLAVGGAALKGDTIRLASVELPVRASLTGRTLHVERAELTSDVGIANLVGTFDPESFDKLLDRPGVKLDASVDVAKLAAVMPKLLQIREGTEIREGKVTVSVESKAGALGTEWSGNISTSALKAIREQQEFRWDEPLSVVFTGRIKAGQLPTFDKLICQSDFIALNAKIAPDSVRAAANVYLDRLAMRLSEFVDLGGITLDGEASAWVVATRTQDAEVTAEANVELKRFACLDRGGKGLREPALKLHLKATGKATDSGHVSLSTASLRGTAGIDELDLSLLEPISDVNQLSNGKFDAKVSGDLARWRRRVAAVVPVLDDYRLEGAAEAHGIVRLAQDALHIDQLTLAIENAKFVDAGLDIDEPTMSAVADLTVNTKTSITTFANFSITSAPLTVTRGQLVIESPKGGQTVVYGGGPAVSNLNRLGKSLGICTDAQGPSPLFGKGTGPIQFRYSGDVTTFNGHLDVINFVVGPRADPSWKEPTLALDVDGSYTQSTDTVAFKSAKVERPGLALTATGSIGRFDTTTDANLAGTLSYDYVKLTPLLREFLGNGFAVAGKGTKPVSFVGSLTPIAKPGSKLPPSVFANATGELGVGWDSLQTHGFAMGPGTLQAKLANGVAQVTPITGTFGGGKIAVHPTVRLAPEPGEITLAKGMIVDKAKLTPATCAGVMGYALPAIANSSKAEGDISVILDENRIPITDTRQASIKGTVVIHKATVTAGPIVTEIAKLLGAENGTMTLANEQSVPVRVERGRVYHENLNVKIGGYFVKTSGSVGFDNSVDLMADVPIPGGMPGLKNTPAIAKALTGKRVLVPIKGTLSHPLMDPKQFQAAIAKLAQSVAKDVSKDVLQRELEKLVPGGLPAPGTTGGGFFPFPIFQKK